MKIYPHQNCVKSTTILLVVFCATSYLFAQGEPSSGSAAKNHKESASDVSARKRANLEELRFSEKQKQARLYRSQGVEYQRIGNIDAAFSLYQKAIELDPNYAVAYNDLGVIFEATGSPERAESSYLQAIKVDQNFLSAYSNLALFYEMKRDLNKAAFYWDKRAELGSEDDPWTQRAKQRLSDIRIVQSGSPQASREKNVIGLMKDVMSQKIAEKGDNRELAKTHFKKAKVSYEKGDEVTALNEALNAQQLDPSNKAVDDFIEKVQTRLLSR